MTASAAEALRAAFAPDTTGQRRILAAIAEDARRSCAACHATLPVADMEPVPTLPGRVRCADEDACRERYTPRRLARSLRGEDEA
jgi:hypothetical protein